MGHTEAATTSNAGKLIRCKECQLELPLRLPLPGETGSSWCCVGCDSRYFGVLDTDATPEILVNVSPASDPNPRIMVGREIVAQLFRRKEKIGRVRESRTFSRSECSEALTLMLPDRRVSAQSLNASAGGIACLADDPIETGQNLMIRFESLAATPVCTGEVTHCTVDGKRFRIGIAFTH